MRAEFFREDPHDDVIGSATWDGGGAHVEAADQKARDTLVRIFRPFPVIVDDPALRSYGTAGPVQLPPGSLTWFRAAAMAGGKVEGLRVRFVPNDRGTMGWDPAGSYRTLAEQVERMELGASDPPGRVRRTGDTD